MNRAEHIGAESNPVLLARLQATLPDGTRSRAGASTNPNNPMEEPVHPSLNSRLPQTTFSASYRDYSQSKGPERKKEVSWLRSLLSALWAHAWLILALAVIGGALGYLYTQRLCVPLYRIQASIEVRNAKSGPHTEALAHVLASQSMVSSVIASLPETERAALVEHQPIPFLRAEDAEETIHERLNADALASAQVIDLTFIAPNKNAGVRFVNGLISALIKREQDEKTVTTTLPDDWNNLPDRNSDDIAIIDLAMPSIEPISPSLPVNLVIFALSGAILGILIALIRKFAVNTFAGPGTLSEVLGVRELGSIPHRKLLGPAGSDTAHAGVQMDANDEALRYLRSSLLYHPGRQQIRFLAFTSAEPGEGKTTIVANLSMSLAATGRRILVIDGDLRRPRLYRLMQVPVGPGLADLLRRDPSAPPASLSRFVNTTSFPNLYVLPPGTAGNDAPELLAGPHLGQLFRELAKSFDFVLIDTPPLLACSDARNYARAVEGVVLVVRSSETQKRAALVARDMLLQDGANIIGTVLTGWRQNFPAYNYHSTPT